MQNGDHHLEPLRFKGDTVGGTLGQTPFLIRSCHARQETGGAQRCAWQAARTIG